MVFITSACTTLVLRNRFWASVGMGQLESQRQNSVLVQYLRRPASSPAILALFVEMGPLVAQKDGQFPQERSTMRCDVAYSSRIVYTQIAVHWLQNGRQILANESVGCQPLVLVANYRSRPTMISPAMMHDKIGKKCASSIFWIIRLLERT